MRNGIMKTRFKEGSRSKAICPKCKDIVTTTFRLADFKYGKHVAKHVLLGFCNLCGKLVSIPHQSVPEIKRQREKNATR
jgi:hypothetical protein